ncbi:MAG: acetate--CoA ligase family protein [Pseudomonadota bacterium]
MLDRLLKPRSIAVIGGGVWCGNVIEECRKIGFEGALWPVHPNKPSVAGIDAYPTVEALPEAPDAAFIGVNRETTVEIVRALATRGAGGAICFASGFREASGESDQADALQNALIAAAGEMPIIGPNCYGLINALDGVALWPDQHGARRVDSGVALITQSSNIAINLTMQKRSLPIAYVLTAGNQAQRDIAELGIAALEDTRVTALGLHIEGIKDLRRFEVLAARARDLGKSIVALKIGASEHAQEATISHTASLAGSDAGARALFRRLGVAQVESLAELLETLKLLHVTGPLSSDRIASMSCSGGEASLVADTALPRHLRFPPLDPSQKEALRAVLGPRVRLSNPLDYHTYIWGDLAATTACFTALMRGDLALGCVILDLPLQEGADISLWRQVIDAAAATRDATGVPMAIVASLTETLPEEVAREAMALGLVPLCGLQEAMAAIEAAAWLGRERAAPDALFLPATPEASTTTRILTEAEAKAALGEYGLTVPKSRRVKLADLAAACQALSPPFALKAEGVAHKTEAGAVALNLETSEAVRSAAERMQAESFLLEEMAVGKVVELLLGIRRDPAHGFVLTLGAGGTLTELWRDTSTRLLPVGPDEIARALSELRIWPLIQGYRGAPPADLAAITRAVLAFQDFAADHRDTLWEAEINPLLCVQDGAIAVDALIRLEEPDA